MGAKDRGPRPQMNAASALRDDLKRNFRWRADKVDRALLADPMGWWADATVLGRLGSALGDLFRDDGPTVVLGPQSRGALLGALVATHLGTGLVELRKDPALSADSDRWIVARTPPDYRDRNLLVGVRTDHLMAHQRVLMVDDWAQTGGQATAARSVVEQAGASWCGAAVIVDGLNDSRLRRDFDVRSLLRVRDLH